MQAEPVEETLMCMSSGPHNAEANPEARKHFWLMCPMSDFHSVLLVIYKPVGLLYYLREYHVSVLSNKSLLLNKKLLTCCCGRVSTRKLASSLFLNKTIYVTLCQAALCFCLFL